MLKKFFPTETRKVLIDNKKSIVVSFYWKDCKWLTGHKLLSVAVGEPCALAAFAEDKVLYQFN